LVELASVHQYTQLVLHPDWNAKPMKLVVHEICQTLLTCLSRPRSDDEMVTPRTRTCSLSLTGSLVQDTDLDRSHQAVTELWAVPLPCTCQ